MVGNVYPLRSVEDEASEWVACVERGCTPEQRKRLDAWLAADPRHRKVFEEMSRHWQHLGAVAARLSSSRLPPKQEDDGVKRWLSPALPWASAATILLILASIFVYKQATVDHPAREIHATEVGEHRSVTLADRSTVDLNTATHIEVELTGTRRLVRLTAGEAMFKVAQDPHRPFMVIAGSSVVRAVGTAFAVRIAPDHTRVVVTEGRVLVSPLQSQAPAGDSTTDKLLSAGEAVSITTTIGRVAKVELRDLDRTLAWRRGVLNIQDQPLGEVIAEVERYTAAHIEIADPGLNTIKVGGYFKATDLEAFLTLLEGQFPIEAERVSPDRIVLRRRH